VSQRADTTKNWTEIGRLFDSVEVEAASQFTIADIDALGDMSSLYYYADTANPEQIRAAMCGLPAMAAHIEQTEAIVLDQAGYDLATAGYEVYSAHLLASDAARVVAIERRESHPRPVKDRREMVCGVVDEAAEVLAEREAGGLLPLVANSAELGAMRSFRRTLALAGRPYAMRVPAEYEIGYIINDLDESDDALDTSDCVVDVFEIHAQAPELDRPIVLRARDLRDPDTGEYIPEYLWALPTDDGIAFYVARSGLSSRVQTMIRLERVLSLLRLANSLGETPLADHYRAHEFHHPSDDGYERVLMMVAYSRVARSV
jgi:hypothetical protein